MSFFLDRPRVVKIQCSPYCVDARVAAFLWNHMVSWTSSEAKWVHFIGKPLCYFRFHHHIVDLQ